MTQTDQFESAIGFPWAGPLRQMHDFQNPLIPRKFGVFASGFVRKTTQMLLQNSFSHVFGSFKFLTQTDHFAKAIAFAWATAFA